MSEMEEKEFWLLVRQAFLLLVDAIERKLHLPAEQRTAEMRKRVRAQ